MSGFAPVAAGQSQVWPPVNPRTLERQVWDAGTARSLPGVAKALQLYMGLIGSCALERVKGEDILPRPRFLERFDPDMPQPTFVGAHVEDFWLHGNVAALVTVRDAEGYPAAARYYPAHRWGIRPEYDDRGDILPGGIEYLLDGSPVRRENVIHVQRGTDDSFPYRGMGVVEQHLRTLNRAGLEEAAESANLLDRGTPAVAIITPNVEPNQTEFDAAADRWVERFAGTSAKPAFFPKDTQVIPLSWNPTDAQMVEARAMSTKDIAGIFNLDPYWLGAEGSSHTYRSPGPMFLVLLKLSLGPVMDVFEDVWSHAWCPGIGTRGTRIRFDRASLLRDDLATMVQAFTTGADLFPDKNEARRYMGFPALPAESWGGDDQDTIARTLQQVYLAVGKVITTDEARAIANKAGADLPIPAPVDLSAAAVQTPPTDAPETPEEPTEETTTDE